MQHRFRKSLFGGGERMDILSRFFAVPGALFLRWIDALGDTFLFLLEGLRQIFIAPKLFIKVLHQLVSDSVQEICRGCVRRSDLRRCFR